MYVATSTILFFFKIFENYIEYLNKIFQLFDNLDMILKRLKIYIAYLLIILLGQRVNDLNIIYSEERIAAISKFNFPATLKELKKYVSLTE